MPKRFVSIWFRHLLTDRVIRQQPSLRNEAFVLASPERGRVVVRAASPAAIAKGIYAGMVVADCRAVFTALQVLDLQPDLTQKLLTALATWCIRFTPIAAIDIPDGIMLDTSGCTHLWGGEEQYLGDIHKKLTGYGYDTQIAIADTAGAAWAAARYTSKLSIVPEGCHVEMLLPLPAAALRLEAATIARLNKLGLTQISSFISMPRRTLCRRFGDDMLCCIDRAVGQKAEVLTPVIPPEPYQERLPCLEPIRTAIGIQIALERLLKALCGKMEHESKGLRKAVLKGYRIDGNIQQIEIGTSLASCNPEHLFKLFDLKIAQMEPALGFELFTLDASVVEDISAEQYALWNKKQGHDPVLVGELLDKVAGKMGWSAIRRYLPEEHYWPERSMRQAETLDEQPVTAWPENILRPVHMLAMPEEIQVTVPKPDYPPMLFLHMGMLHQIKKADGPERIEQEWWLQHGKYRDYYIVEDEQGGRYWLFRSGDYSAEDPKWYLHGFFA